VIIAKQQFLDDELVDHTVSARQSRRHGQSGVVECVESGQPRGRSSCRSGECRLKRSSPSPRHTAAIRSSAAVLVADELSSLAAAQDPRRLKARFKNLLSACGGLFRYREVEPYALLRANDPLAGRMRDAPDQLQAVLESRANAISQVDEKRALIADLIRHLDGHGDPKILARIEEADDVSDEDGD